MKKYLAGYGGWSLCCLLSTEILAWQPYGKIVRLLNSLFYLQYVICQRVLLQYFKLYLSFISFFSICRAEYSYTGAASFETARNKHRKTSNNLHNGPGEPSRQFGRNAYVWHWTLSCCYIYYNSLGSLETISPVKAKDSIHKLLCLISMEIMVGKCKLCVSLHILLILSGQIHC